MADISQVVALTINKDRPLQRFEPKLVAVMLAQQIYEVRQKLCVLQEAAVTNQAQQAYQPMIDALKMLGDEFAMDKRRGDVMRADRGLLAMADANLAWHSIEAIFRTAGGEVNGFRAINHFLAKRNIGTAEFNGFFGEPFDDSRS